MHMFVLWHEWLDNDKDKNVSTNIIACLNIVSGLSADDVQMIVRWLLEHLCWKEQTVKNVSRIYGRR